MKWENTTNEEVLERARAEIRRSWQWACDDGKDHPRAAELFRSASTAGIPRSFRQRWLLAARSTRLRREAHASDLNPVAVLINKAMIEIPPMFAGRPPVNPEVKITMLTNR